jgi:hypothetical protein
MPAFDNIETEANEFTESEYERLGELPYDENEIDMSASAERAQEAGFEYFSALSSVRQTFLNLSVAALFHMFEQQLLCFHRRQVLHPSEENDIARIRTSELKKRLLSAGIDIESLQSWKDIHELELVANSVKHAEGRSSEELQGLRPDLFVRQALSYPTATNSCVEVSKRLGPFGVTVTMSSMRMPNSPGM